MRKLTRQTAVRFAVVTECEACGRAEDHSCGFNHESDEAALEQMPTFMSRGWFVGELNGKQHEVCELCLAKGCRLVDQDADRQKLGLLGRVKRAAEYVLEQSGIDCSGVPTT